MASVTEFISVWALGGEASLNLATRNGITNVAFNCHLGHPGAPHSLPPAPTPAPPPQSPPRQPRHRGQAEREKNRQRAAQHQAALARTAASASSATSSSTAPMLAPGSPSTVSVSEACSTATDSVVNSVSILTAPVMSFSSSHATEPVVSAAPTVSGKSANTDDVQQSPPLLSFKCDQCDFVGASDKGLKQHTRMKHQISQVDGNDSDLEDRDINDLIDTECMQRFEQITECASCSKIFKTAKECYVHMLLSTSKCCQTTITNFKENGRAEDLKTLGIQRLMLKMCYLTE